MLWTVCIAAAVTLCTAAFVTVTVNGSVAAASDWLLAPPHVTSQVIVSEQSHEIAVDNGLLRRTFRVSPNFATVGYKNLSTGEELIRSVKPEATFQIDGKNFEVGDENNTKEYHVAHGPEAVAVSL